VPLVVENISELINTTVPYDVAGNHRTEIELLNCEKPKISKQGSRTTIWRGKVLLATNQTNKNLQG